MIKSKQFLRLLLKILKSNNLKIKVANLMDSSEWESETEEPLERMLSDDFQVMFKFMRVFG